jgi:hypothetical protein
MAALRKTGAKHRWLVRADEVVKGTVVRVLGLAVMVMLAGCGGSSGDQVTTWNVATYSGNALELTRAWEVCGGTVSCSYVHEAPPNRTAIGGFIGSATAGQVACYKIYTGSNNVLEGAGKCQEL